MVIRFFVFRFHRLESAINTIVCAWKSVCVFFFLWVADFIETLCGLLWPMVSILFCMYTLLSVAIYSFQRVQAYRKPRKKQSFSNRASPCFNKTLKRSAEKKKQHHLNEFLVIHFSFVHRDRPRCARATLSTWVFVKWARACAIDSHIFFFI